MTETEKLAKDLFVALLRTREEGVNFSIKEFGNSWEVCGGAFDTSGHIKKFSAVLYKNNNYVFSLCLFSNTCVEKMTVEISKIEEQARWLVTWLKEEEQCTTKKPKKR